MLKSFRHVTPGNSQWGLTLLETLVALLILGTIAVAFLSGLVTSTRAAFNTDEQATAVNLAQSQMEWVKSSAFVVGATTYTPAIIPSDSDYDGYSVNITAVRVNPSDDYLQKITVTVARDGETVMTLEGYKGDR